MDRKKLLIGISSCLGIALVAGITYNCFLSDSKSAQEQEIPEIPKIEDKTLDLFTDYKSVLQELVQTDKRVLKYEVVSETGPSHDKTFTVVVKIDDIIYGRGIAKSKKEAEQQAACDALKKAQNG